MAVAGVESPSLRVVGTLPGLAPLLASGACGPGVARLRTAGDGAVAFRAPGSAAWGSAQPIAADGTYVLEDGQNRDASLRVAAHVDYLPAAAAEALVYLRDRFGNHVGHDDVSAAEAAAGHDESWAVTLVNAGHVVLHDLVAWVEAGQGVAISDDDAAWVTPTDEAHGLALADLVVDATDTLYVQRTTAAGAVAVPELLTLLHVAFTGL